MLLRIPPIRRIWTAPNHFRTSVILRQLLISYLRRILNHEPKATWTGPLSSMYPTHGPTIHRAGHDHDPPDRTAKPLPYCYEGIDNL